ncbi:uncharacterized protein BJ171DRAFT_632482 [Polychytrium aggregatum]|uniref:uncharacterized protein n=1 Tax=Polychytrium aggregatum TaxID=110093 RepID=UPI0022FDEB2F|nr:uncharacterized protein BJ171DRAFT_632482 [Polychytrium aggregatum]KAI9197514.1 hypothetical protein BJ171DRAFT_632482 [Polychytrium aggregatum]
MDPATEIDVNGAIREYLLFADYRSTLASFDLECTRKGRSPQNPGLHDHSHRERMDQIQEDVDRFMIFFHEGNRADFFQSWNQAFDSETQLSDPTFQKLEFNLHVYFAVFAIHPFVGPTHARSVDLAVEMDAFKGFLENRGRELCKTPQFLPFYALPYVVSPKDHPSFSDIFDQTWTQNLQERLRHFLEGALRSHQRPRLLTLVAMGDTGIGKKDYYQECRVLRQKNQALVDREQFLVIKHRGLQGDYHNLISIASELVQTLASCINGEQITAAYLANICARLNSFKADGTTRQLEQSGTNPAKMKELQERETAGSMEMLLQQLNYKLLLEDLDLGSQRMPARDKALLIQAVRMLFMKHIKSHTSARILSALISRDFLSIRSNQGVLPNLAGTPPLVLNQLSKLLNVVASHYSGREYLLGQGQEGRDNPMVCSLVELLQQEERDTATRQNLLGTLQKLSLRRCAQSTMNNLNVVLYLHDMLEDLENLSEYSIEYGTALLMNLCKEQWSKHLLYFAVKTYVNGALFSILAEPAIREHARAMGMGHMLEYMKGSLDEQLVKQVDFIIDQLNSEEQGESSADAVSEDGEEDDFEEEDLDDEFEESFEADDANVLAAQPNELCPTIVGSRSPSVSTGIKGNGRSFETVYQRATQRRSVTPFSRPVTPSRERYGPKEELMRESIKPAARKMDPSSLRPIQSPIPTTEPPPLPAALEKALPQITPAFTRKGKPMEDMSAREVQEFQTAFGTRPKIPRTPLTTSMNSVTEQQ